MTSINVISTYSPFNVSKFSTLCKGLRSANVMLYSLSPFPQTVQIALIDICTTFSDCHLRDWSTDL